jgi:FKBP-type peptidyl-prolyl cis-trans isomerase
MKTIIVLSLVLVLSVSLISENLIQKYSIEVLNEGTPDTHPKKGDSVEMHYEGTLTNGKVFDSSYTRGSPLPLRIGSGQVIVCWDEVGLQLNIGAKVKVLCPSNTAYGSRAVGPIPANSDLVFTIERVK